jgi:peroxiredoxin
MFSGRCFMIKFLTFGFILFICISCVSQKETAEVGQPAPLFSTSDYSGRSFDLADYQGKQLLIHFWADWCAECRAEFPKLEKAYQKHKDNNFEILAVNVAQSEKHVRSFVEEFGLTFPMLMDEKSEIAKMFGIRGLPTNYFVDADMTIKKIIIGWVDEKQIEQVLNQ